MTGTARTMRVLVADDDSAIRTLVSRVLARRGYSVETACDGAEAIEMLGRLPFDLLVLDLMMPRVDGVGVITELAGRPAPRPPVLVMTAAVADILRRVPEGAVAGVILKPFDLELLLKAVDAAIETGAAAAR
jgi:two-component system response regulator MprA